jgi:iron complex transport system substrate-binding protein
LPLSSGLSGKATRALAFAQARLTPLSALARAGALPAKLLLADGAKLLLAGALIAISSLSASAGRMVTDSAGRQVEIPDHVERVQASGPPASVLLTMLAPEKLAGWVRKPREAELPYLPAVVRNLPELGRLTGRGDTANVEVVLAAKPDVIIDFGSVSATYVSLADRVQSQTGIPYLLVDGRFANTPAALRLVGKVLGVDDRAELLARRTEEILRETDEVVASVPAEQRPRVYLARQADGLESGNRGSINTEIIERAGGVNVVEGGRERGGLSNVSLEQVLAWNPDTIITTDRNFIDSVQSAAPWSQTEALRRHRVYLSPNLPFGWVDAPPSLNRLLGLQWLQRLFFPDRFHDNIRAVVGSFYHTFYQVDLGEPDLDRLLTGVQH